MRLHDAVKSGLCESLKWGSKTGAFALKVPNKDSTKALRVWLKSHAEPAATYFSTTGHIQAWQWNLSLLEFRSVWTAKGPVLVEDAQ